MRIGAVGMMPYVYNTNMVSALSMNRVSAVPEDVTKHKIDYTGLAAEQAENVNPLRIGQSANFMDILASQMSMSRYHQSRVMKEELLGNEGASSPASEDAEDDVLSAVRLQEHVSGQEQPDQSVLPVKASGEAAKQNASDRKTGNAYNLYRMNHALEAYNMSMGIA